MTEQRTRILEAATDLFLEIDFDGVTVEKIATRARVSKSAIYEQFGGKDGLFDAVIGYACVGMGAPSIEPFAEEFELKDILRNAGRTTAHRIFHPKGMRVVRLAISAYNQNPKPAKIFWEHGPVRAANHVAEALARVKKRTRRRAIDPHTLSIDFVNSITGPFMLTSVLGVTPLPTKKEINATVERIIDEFLERYNLEDC